MEFKDKKVLVYGAGKSGIGACDLLTGVGAKPVLYDEKADLSEEGVAAKLKTAEGVAFVFGELSDSVIKSADLCVLSPGVPTDLPSVGRIRKAGVPIIGEVELAYLAGKGHVLAITGTNGKTTTTSLLGKILSDHDPNTFVVGNIGIAYTTVAPDMKEDSSVAAEISSFQLETTDAFHPCVSAILNITEDHLNRHHTMEEYIRVKERIAERQDKNDACVLNYEDEVLRAFGESIKERTNVIYFSSKRKIPGGIYLDEDRIIIDFGPEKGVVIRTGEAKIIGVHNYENIMAAVAMAAFYGIPMEEIRASVRSFTAVPHRIEYVREVRGVVYYNDSKGTNPDAAIKGIEAMSRPTYLIGGGYDKGSDYRPWILSFRGRVKKLVLEGKTRFDIEKQALECGFPKENIIIVETMKEAFAYCAEKAEAGDAVLLSPACASWGEFPNYEVRGDIFKEYVNAL